MNNPLVCAVMLTRDRPQMAARAVRSFREQTYPNRCLFVLDSGKGEALTDPMRAEFTATYSDVDDRTIGHLRNLAIKGSDVVFGGKAAIFVHFDDDDWSHPNRIAEQVAHLQQSGADVVGYSELLFWREAQMGAPGSIPQAWLYKSHVATQAPGTSLCYWRKTWERKPFPDLPRIINGKNVGTSEDCEWLKGLDLATMTSLPNPLPCYLNGPRMIASIHGENTMQYDNLERSTSWWRVPQFDSLCAERMKL